MAMNLSLVYQWLYLNQQCQTFHVGSISTNCIVTLSYWALQNLYGIMKFAMHVGLSILFLSIDFNLHFLPLSYMLCYMWFTGFHQNHCLMKEASLLPSTMWSRIRNTRENLKSVFLLLQRYVFSQPLLLKKSSMQLIHHEKNILEVVSFALILIVIFDSLLSSKSIPINITFSMDHKAP